MGRHCRPLKWGIIFILGWCSLAFVPSVWSQNRIYIRDSFLQGVGDPGGYDDNTIEIGLQCSSPLAALQFTLSPITPSVELLPLMFQLTYPGWYYQAENTQDGGLRVILVDTLLSGRALNPHGEEYPFCKIGCRLDSAAAWGIFPLHISAVQACDTNGNELTLESKDGWVTITDKQSLLFARADTLVAGERSYTWNLYEANAFPVGEFSFRLRPPTPGFNLQSVSTNLPCNYWERIWTQDTTGLIAVDLKRISPLKLGPCISEKKIVPINLTFQLDSSLKAGVYQFSFEDLVVWDCTDNFRLTSTGLLEPLIVVDSAPVKVVSSSMPQNWYLGPIFPNPFNSITTIEYDVPQEGSVELAVYDLKGRRISQLVKQMHQPGHYQCRWTGCDQEGQAVASGVYLVRMAVGGRIMTQKMLFVK